MKPEQKLTACYADLLSETSDDALDKLVRELDTAYTAPARPAGLSWATASQRLALVPQQTLNVETHSPVRPLRLRTLRGRKKVLLAFAAIVAIALLSATLLTTIGGAWSRQNHQARTSPSLFAADALLLQQLLQNAGTPANIRQLAQSSQFTDLNLTKVTDTGNVVIQKVYADANNVVFVYIVDRSTWEKAKICNSLTSAFLYQPGQCRPVPVLTVTTSDRQTLTENAERIYVGSYKNQRFGVLAYYDASSIQGRPKQVHLTVSLAKKVSPSQESIGEFTVPFHADKTAIDVNRTVTSHGDALTLERVIISQTEVRFDSQELFSSKREAILYPTQLSIAGKSYDANPFSASTDAYRWFGFPGSSHFVSFYDSLESQTGTWTLTEEARVWTDIPLQNPLQGSHLDIWTFTFTAAPST